MTITRGQTKTSRFHFEIIVVNKRRCKLWSVHNCLNVIVYRDVLFKVQQA